MKFCKECKACVGDDVLECPHCGAEEWSDTEPQAEESVIADDTEAAVAEPEVEDAAEEDSAEETQPEASEETSADETAEDSLSEENAEETQAEADEEPEEDASEETESEGDELPDDADTDEELPQGVDKKKIGIIAGSVLGTVAVIIAVICVFTFVDFNRNPAYRSKEKTFVADENVTGDTAAPIPFVSNPPYEMSESFGDYQININGAVYQVPMPVQEIINSGWAFGGGENTERTLGKEETVDTYFVSKDGAVMYATIINFGKNDTAVDKCYVSRLKIDYKDNNLIKMFMTGNLSLGVATRQQVEELIGESADVVELATEIVVRYKKSDKANATLTYNSKTSVLESVEFINSKKPNNFEETTLPLTTNAGGGTEVIAPQELGKDFTSGVVQIQGEIYKLPIKVNELLNNGWDISYQEDRAILYPGEHIVATFTKGDVKISGLDIHNVTDEELLIKNCQIIEVSSSSDNDYEVIFPANLKAGMKDAEFQSIIQGMEYDFSDVNFDEYVFYNGAYTLMVVVDKDEAAVSFVLMTYDEENLNK